MKDVQNPITFADIRHLELDRELRAATRYTVEDRAPHLSSRTLRVRARALAAAMGMRA